MQPGKKSADSKKQLNSNGKAKKINLALQGGGALGAYTWGVLDRILEDERLLIDSISGTSAGAMNAAVLCDGYIRNGREGARKALKKFWEDISLLGTFSPLQHAPFQKTLHHWNMDWSPTYAWFDVMTRLFSPYQTNPLNINPLRDVVAKSIDFKKLSESDIQLFVTATCITTGQPKVFSHNELTLDAVMASAALPFLFQAVEINGDHYWDGGYMGNPSIWPLYYNSKVRDVVIVEINPIVRKGNPTDGNDIVNRLNEISFNASLIAEMRAVNFVNKLIDGNLLKDPAYQKVHVHLIESAKEMRQINASSKLNASMEFFNYLYELGHHAAEKWIKTNFDMIGKDSSVDIGETFLGYVKHPKMEKKDVRKHG